VSGNNNIPSEEISNKTAETEEALLKLKEAHQKIEELNSEISNLKSSFDKEISHVSEKLNVLDNIQHN
jgi:hypothetical protein